MGFPLGDAILADWKQRNALVALIPCHTLRSRIECQDPIDQERISVVAVLELEGYRPCPVRTLTHGILLWIPAIEVSDEGDGFRIRCGAKEVDGTQCLQLRHGDFITYNGPKTILSQVVEGKRLPDSGKGASCGCPDRSP